MPTYWVLTSDFSDKVYQRPMDTKNQLTHVRKLIERNRLRHLCENPQHHCGFSHIPLRIFTSTA